MSLRSQTSISAIDAHIFSQGRTMVAFLVYWLIFFVSCLTVVEVGQDYFYDAVTPNSGTKVALGTAVLAAVAVWMKPGYDTMFTSDIAWTILQAMIWFAVFVVAFQFHPSHALGLSLLTLVIIAGIATLGVDSLTKPRLATAPIRAQGTLPVRRSLSPSEPVTKPAEPAPAK